MAEFTADLQSFRPSFPFFDIDSMELINQFKTVNPHVLDNSNFNYMQNFMPFSSDSFFDSTEPEFLGNLEENFSGLVHYVNHNAVPVSLPISSAENDTHEDKKRKAMGMRETCSVNSSPAVAESASKIKDVNFLLLFSFYSSFIIRNKIHHLLNWLSWIFYV